MPQASDELTKKVQEYFKNDPEGCLDSHCSEYLIEQGYKEDRFQWHPKPGVKTVEDMTQQEYDCMRYLIDEWDWGGLIGQET